MGRDLIRATLVATATVSVAFGLLQLAMPAAEGAGTYATSSAAVALAAAAAGLTAGLLAVALSALTVAYAHLPPLEAWHVEHATDGVGLLLFTLNGVVVAIVTSYLRWRHVSTARPVHGVADQVSIRPASHLPQDSGSVGVRRRADRPAGLVEPLTDRELEVLELLAAGMSNEAIAASLFLSVNTVKTHLKNVYGKLQVSSRTQAIAQGQALGIIEGRSVAGTASGSRTAA
jgi:DNA-binding CsgD family transcriptional regulator